MCYCKWFSITTDEVEKFSCSGFGVGDAVLPPEDNSFEFTQEAFFISAVFPGATRCTFSEMDLVVEGKFFHGSGTVGSDCDSYQDLSH